MQPTYFASFLLGEKAEAVSPSIPEAVDVVAEWIFENPYRQLARPQGWPEHISEPIIFPDGERVHLLRFDAGSNGLHASAIRFEHADQQSRFWRTDCVLTQIDEPEPAVRFAVTVAAGGSGDDQYAVSPPRTRPRIVRAMMDKFGGRERYPLKSTFFRIKAEEAERFAGFLLDPQRTIPLVFISRRNHDGEVLCDPFELADKLVGIAYVCVAEDTQLSWKLAHHLENRLNAYDGTVRVYWPRMTSNDAPYRHRWWDQRRIETMRRPLSDEILGLIASASVTRHIAGLVRWEDIEREITKQTMQRLQNPGAVSTSVSEDWLRQYETDLASLESAREELSTVSDRLLEKEEEVRQWKQMYLQALRSRASDSGATPSNEILIEDVETAIEIAKQDFSDRIEVMDGRIAKEASQFEEPELLYAAFKWLATTYWNSKAGGPGCDDLDKSCRENCQFRYNAHQSEITMGMFASDYEVTHLGSKVKLKEHIGYGTSTEPRHTIRIAFFFDEKQRKVIVGYIGQHQATRRSN